MTKVIEEIAEGLLQKLGQELEFKRASVQLIVEGRRSLVGTFGFSKKTAQSRLLRPIETDSLINEIVQNQTPKIIEFTDRNPNWQKQPETADVNSWIGLAIVSQGRTLGIVTLDHDKPGFYKDLPLTVLAKLDQLTTWAAEGINQALALEAEKRRYLALQVYNKGLQLILSIGKDMLKATQLGDVLNAIVRGAMELTNSDSGVLFLLNSDGTEVIDKFHPVGVKHPAPRLNRTDGITRTIISTGELVSIPDIEKDPRVNPELRKEYRCMFGIPLKQGTFVMGVLFLNGRACRDLTPTERSLLLTLVDQAVLAIQIKNSEAMYNAIPQFVMLKDKESRFRAANRTFCNSLSKGNNNLLEKELIGRRDKDFYDIPRAAEYVAGDQDVMLTKQKREFDEIHKSPNMEKAIYVHVVKSPVLDAKGDVVGVQAIFWDVTEQQRMRQRWESLIEQSPDSILVHEGGTITLANPAAVRLFGAQSVAALKGRSIFEFLSESSRVLAEERLRTLTNKEEVEQGVVLKVRKQSGEILDVEVFSAPGPGDNEVQVILHDLTRRKRLLGKVEELAKQAQATAQWSQRVRQVSAHESRAPLQTIVSLLADLKQKIQTGRPEAILKLCKKIEGQAFRAKQQMDNALTFDKASSYSFGYPSLSFLVKTTVLEFESRAAARDIDIVVDQSINELARAYVDTDRMAQVIRNLLDNGVKYSSKGAKFVVRGAQTDTRISLMFENYQS